MTSNIFGALLICAYRVYKGNTTKLIGFMSVWEIESFFRTYWVDSLNAECGRGWFNASDAHRAGERWLRELGTHRTIANRVVTLITIDEKVAARILRGWEHDFPQTVSWLKANIYLVESLMPAAAKK